MDNRYNKWQQLCLKMLPGFNRHSLVILLVFSYVGQINESLTILRSEKDFDALAQCGIPDQTDDYFAFKK